VKLTIVIVNYNVQYFLEQCLLSVEKAVQGMEAEVYVVDNNSVDGSVAMVAAKFPWVQLIANKENTGFSRANNQAMRVAKGEYILLLNPDTVVEEDTFHKVVRFMDEHPAAGGLGVKMVDGKGNFLPESKRGLPTPEVSFYKIFGLSKLFPKSKRFNRYHLGYLDNDQVHEIEILSGAFMLMRKEALDKVGLLDEAFFMYGEDIDLSWRIIQGGYKNYYFPHTRIIHYKGESTKKGSLNYVFVFYNAMVIFAKKHFSEKNAKLFSFFINMAIWLRAGVAVLNRFLKSILLPVADVLVISLALRFISHYYAEATHNIYDERILKYYFLIAGGIWAFGAWLSGANDKPIKPLRVVKPAIIGGAVLIIAYSLLPETMRFSRAVMLIAPVVAMVVMFMVRIVFNLITTRKTGLEAVAAARYAIVGKADEAERVKSILQQTQGTISYIAGIAPTAQATTDDIGDLSQLDEIVRVHEIDHVIFCARDVTASDIIGAMSNVADKRIEFKIAPPESLYIIGSNSIETSGEVFMMDVNSVSLEKNKRAKRMLDIGISLVCVPLLPLLLFIVKKPIGLVRNMLQVLIGKKSWIGFSGEMPKKNEQTLSLPKLKPGVLDPLVANRAMPRTAENIIKLNVLYAKDYRLRNDLNILAKGIREMGR
jgi:GT2 family glycosyltransferase/lipopolysaccharide/colanic/teichoic acid biosynthesis glycosyltransferase